MTMVKDSVTWNKNLNQLDSFKKLQELAKNPIDLTRQGEMTPERIAKYYAEACGYQFLYATERINEEVVRALADLAREAEAMQKMEAMQSGETLNFIEGYPSENRPVLHTALRDFFDNPNKSKAAKEAADLAKKECDKLKKFMQKIDRQNYFTDFIMIAIGGSELGPEANYIALEHLKKDNRHVHFVSNVDPDDAQAVLNKVNLATTLVAIVSKSGTTLETRINEEFVKARFVLEGLSPEKHFISITCPGTPMDNPDNYLETFHLWEWVGGRFSTSSMVGGVMLSFMYGYEVYEEFLKGCHAMDQAALKQDLRQNLPLLGALISVWNRNFLGYPTLALIPYAQPLRRYSAHIQQVEMESNGKHIDRHGRFVDFHTGPIIWGEPGTNAQHSFYQLIHQGTDIIPLEFIGFKEGVYGEDLELEGTTSHEKLLSNLFAQAISLAVGQKSDNPNKDFEGNRPSHILLAKQLTPFTLGALFAYYENKVAFEGFLWNINSFDQEGVQLGKELSNRIIDRFFAKRNPGSKKGKEYPLGDAYLKILDTIH